MQAQDESRAAAAKPLNEPQHLLLPGGGRLPLLGLGTFQLQSADAVAKALERECCCWEAWRVHRRGWPLSVRRLASVWVG